MECATRTLGSLIGANAASLGFRRAEVLPAQVSTTLARPPRAPYDLVLSDPPYPLPAAAVLADLTALVAHGWLVPGALVVVERGTRGADLIWPEGLGAERDRTYGETRLWYGLAAPAEASSRVPAEEE